MYDDYEDYYGSELNALTDEYLEKVKNCFKDDVKNLVLDIKAQQKRNEEESKALLDRELAVQKLEKEIASLQDKKDEIILEFMKQYGLDLQIGQQVYVIKQSSERIRCNTCHDTRKIKIQVADKEFEINCPDCKGYQKTKATYDIVSKYVVGIEVKFKIQKDNYNYPQKIKIQGVLDFDKLKLETVILGDSSDKKDYCGSHYNRKDVYLTKDDAENALKELNEKNEEK